MEMQTKLQLAIKDLEKYSTEKLCLELKEADLCEEVEKCISKCATKDVATFDDHVDGFNRALAQVAALYPNVDLFGTRIYKDVVDGKVINSSSLPRTLAPKVFVLQLSAASLFFQPFPGS